MSAIAGILNAKERPADPAAIQQMLQMMAHRGPDGSSVWHQAHVAFGHRLLIALPERQSLGMPLVDGYLALTADARLDNRDELLATLRLDASTSEAAVIVAAYRRWGEDCPAHLLGDFAFALWDGGRELLFCARDHFGVKPFYYYAGRGRFLFASEIKGLFALAEVPREIEEAGIADYLAARPPDGDTTFYRDILRLPPSHSLTVSAAGRHLRAYWHLDPPPMPAGDPAEQFRDLLTEAVRCRLRGGSTAGAMLSGGLDSSSVACIAAPIFAKDYGRRLPTLSTVFDETPAWSERPFIESVLAPGGFDPLFLSADDHVPFAQFERILAEQEGAFLAPSLTVSRNLYWAAAARGIRVLLDGHGGDEVVSHGHGRLHELAAANRWFALWREAGGVAATYGERTWPLYAAVLRRYGSGRRLRSLSRRVTGALRRLYRPERPAKTRTASYRFINTDLVARTGLVERARAQSRQEREAMKSERTWHTFVLSSNLHGYGFEILDRAAAAAGVEARYPFWDKRLVEFCVALPSQEKLAGGWTRLILRRAMEGILPASVQWRRDKLDFTPHIVRGILRHHRALLDDILVQREDGIDRYVNLAEVSAALQRMAAEPEAASGLDVQAVWRTVVLTLWLRQTHRQIESSSVVAA